MDLKSTGSMLWFSGTSTLTINSNASKLWSYNPDTLVWSAPAVNILSINLSEIYIFNNTIFCACNINPGLSNGLYSGGSLLMYNITNDTWTAEYVLPVSNLFVSSVGECYMPNSSQFSILTKNYMIINFNGRYLTDMFVTGDAIMVNCVTVGANKFASFTPMLNSSKS